MQTYVFETLDRCALCECLLLAFVHWSFIQDAVKQSSMSDVVGYSGPSQEGGTARGGGWVTG